MMKARANDLERQIDRLRQTLRIAVVHGGNKAQQDSVIHPAVNSRAWKSYEAVAHDIAEALCRLGFRQVCVLPEDMRLGDEMKRRDIHFAWLNSGGVQGYNPVAHGPSMLEMMGIPYVGHDPLTASTLDNKHIFKQALLALGLPTSPFITWNGDYGRFDPAREVRFRHAFGDYAGPFVVKPVSGRASLHVQVVDRIDDLADALQEIWHKTQNLALIERFLPGREYAVAVAGRIVSQGRKLIRRSDPFVFSPVERVLKPDERIFTSMDHSPISTDRFRALRMDDVPSLSDIAHRVFTDAHLRTLVRIDIRADAAGRLFILEANPKPDLKAPSGSITSLVCAGLDEHGMDYDDLILSLLAERVDVLVNHPLMAVRHLRELVA
jgi:D-alanine-D-alanine ligase